MSPASNSLMKKSADQGPMRVLHTINSYNSGVNNSSQHPINSEDYNDFKKMMLPAIQTRKLAGLEDSENPFKVIKSSEQLLVFREK